ncbi:PIGG [Acanthosepion pharaonis]|uniref:PIGG n=1 Tax=Acanthosepion pharaonis TaxID=158019 RepID=A0A812BB30_ACAPH|nr:PIGG [Sepia pharaonis]
MPYLHQLLQQGKAIGHYGITHPPTVTLPRIKAMMTGSIPGFIDVVLNFNTNALQEDNLLSQLYKSGKKIIFYGDDTWIKLFPGHFLRHDGTTSFYVTDYTEVDQNVSRHLDWELRQPDWDVMILHYLGLDHIGHLAKPSSPLVEPKLKEMDDIIKKLHEHLILKGDNSPTLMVVCGDHGMSDQGSHGGASKKEVTVAIVWLASTAKNKKVFSQAYPSQSPVIDQIDITPTLALAFGIPIPGNNLGTAIPEIFLSYGSTKDTVRAMYLNAHQVASVLKQNNPKWQADAGYVLFEMAVQHHIDWLNFSGISNRAWHQQGLSLVKQYHSAIKAMSSRMMTKMTKYDIYGMFLCSISLFLLLYGILMALCQTEKSSIMLVFSSASCILSLMLCIFIVCSHVTICTSSYRSEILCNSLLMSGVILTFLLLSITFFNSLAFGFIQSIKAMFDNKMVSFSGTALFLALGCLLHCVSFMSTSFVEEEHQTWYFLTVSVFVVIVIDALRNQLTCHRLTFSSSLNTSDSLRSQKLLPNKIQQSSSVNNKAVLVTVFLLILCRFQRSWNQTGDKWQHLSDTGDWLMRPENKFLLSIVCLSFLLIILVSIWIHRIQQIRSCHQLLLLAALIYIYLFHAATKKLLTPPPWLWNISENGLKESRIVYSLTLLLILETCVVIRMKSISNNRDENVRSITMQSAVLCLKSVSIIMAALLTSHPHNICVLAMATLQEILLRKLLSFIKLPVYATALIYTWMAQATYFYQGHSNNLSSIDVAAGYTGVGRYKPVLVSLILAISTYSGVIFWYSCLINYQLKDSVQQHKTQIENR